MNLPAYLPAEAAYLPADLSLCRFVYKKLYSCKQSVQIVFHDIKHHFAINIEIAVSDMVADANDIFPRNFWAFNQQFALCSFVNLFYALSDSLNQHTAGSKILHAVR